MADRPIFTHISVYVAVAIGIGYASYRSSGSIMGSILAGAAGSFFATGALFYIDKKAAARIKSLGLKDGNYPVEVDALAVLNDKPENVMLACLTAIESLPNFGFIKKYEPGRYILARTRRSRYSWGEKITARVESSSNGTKLSVKSVPVLWTVTEDMRFNFQNVALILRHLHGSIGVWRVEPEGMFSIDEKNAAE